MIDPDGKAYVLQARGDSSSLESLAALGGKLELPAGWQYRSRTLDADLSIVSTGAAHVVQDELKNTYLLDE